MYFLRYTCRKNQELEVMNLKGVGVGSIGGVLKEVRKGNKLYNYILIN